MKPLLNLALSVGFVKVVKVVKWISLSFYMDLSKLIHGFLLETGHATKSEKFKKNYIADFGPS